MFRVYPFDTAKFSAASKYNINELRCEICEYSKAHRRTLQSTKTTVRSEKDGALKDKGLTPGHRVSVDHFETRLLGRTFNSYGSPSPDTFKGDCIFVDHATGFIHVEHQVSFSAVETIRIKQAYETMAMDHGVIIQSYLTDSGAFKTNSFVKHIREHEQKINFCGTNTHHQNGIAERSIRTISNFARAMLLHAPCHWKGGIDSSLWPMAVMYATHVYNNTPKANGLCPADLYRKYSTTTSPSRHPHLGLSSLRVGSHPIIGKETSSLATTLTSWDFLSV